MNRIEIKLMYNGIFILGSEAKVLFFVEKVSKVGKVFWKVYVIVEEDVIVGKIFLVLIEVILEVCEGLLRYIVMFILEMLRADFIEIWLILDNMKIC